MMIQVDNPQSDLKAAIESGAVIGDVYADGEVWVDSQSYWTWARSQSAVIGAPPKNFSHHEGA